ncbi:MAG: TolC family protein [Bdellovibrionales bacterium]
MKSVARVGLQGVVAGVFLLLSVAASGQSAQAPSGAAPAPTLMFADYLEQVQSQNREALSLQQDVLKATLRLEEAEVPLSPELYANYSLFDDRDEATNSFSPFRKQGDSWRLGVRDLNRWGTKTDVFVESQRFDLTVPNPQLIPLRDYADVKAGVQLTQPLWRNGFGGATRAEMEAQRAISRLELLRSRFDLKNLILKAQNTYWSLVSLGQVVKLQEENVERARKLRDWMSSRARLRLVDDVDALQAQASLEQRELELQSSRDEWATMARQFNTLRGVDHDRIEPLPDLPPGEILLTEAKDSRVQMTREDFRMIYERAMANASRARAARLNLGPQLDLVGGITTNGLDAETARAYDEVQGLEHPSWQVGVVFSVPLDYSLIGNMKQSYEAAARAAEHAREHARFAEQRAWEDLLAQKAEAQRRFSKALSLENTQTSLVRKERQRLLNGRTTTFQAITFEQNLATAQIARVRAQLALLQVHNVLKQFEVQE